MTVYILGSQRSAFTVGMTRCEARDANLPFIAFAPTDKIIEALGIQEGIDQIEDREGVERTVEAFSTHGTVVFIDTPAAADRLLDMVDALLAISWDTKWSERRATKEVVN